MRRQSRFVVVGAWLLALGCLGAGAGCDSTGVGNPGQVDLAVSADPVEEPTPGVDGGVVDPVKPALLNAVVVVDEIRLVPCPGQGATPVVFPGPLAIDLVAGTVYPARPAPRRARGAYCGLEAPLGEARRPAEIAGASVFFKARRRDGVEVLLFASVRGTLRVVGRGAAMTVPDDGARWVWGMRPAQWVMGSEVDTLTPVLVNGRPIVVIDADRLPLLFEAIRARLGGVSALFLDEDGDGRLDVEERRPDNVIGDGSPQIDP